ncbi:acyl-CoA dehydrogenase family protein [Aquabacterium sp.]|uniref:acyl-CoA dehydrogenase family protein n=1 Tax=Aquabacterium sp. TaxID=1872578 RepID=UPI002487597C|nr:acyl-CoA dehydrogenase family protein [Aquabacterium sp.]MDI1347805.1 acyl-CoA dehydrogenase family protein [Aquabacterium sp.]
MSSLHALTIERPDHAATPDRASHLDQVPQVADRLTQHFATTAALRDAEGGCPKAQRDELRASGLLALSIPVELGGLGGSWRDVLDVVRQFARVDSSIAHLYAFHHLMLATVTLYGQPEQWRPWLAHTARHDWFWGNALNPRDQRARCSPASGGWLLSGPKSFCSGALDSEMLVVSGECEGQLMVAAVPTSRSGIHIRQDWDNMGQRQTDSGSVQFDRLRIEDGEVLREPGPLSTPRSCLRSLVSQLILVNIYVGIAQGAFEAARRYTREEARPWPGAGVERMADDPYVLAHFGDFHVGLDGAVLLADRAGMGLVAALERGEALTSEERGQLAIHIATAKVAAARSGLDLCNRLFEVTGARSTHAALGLDRYWRNLRTHTLHDPIDHKTRELGLWALQGRLPEPGFYA